MSKIDKRIYSSGKFYDLTEDRKTPLYKGVVWDKPNGDVYVGKNRLRIFLDADKINKVHHDSKTPVSALIGTPILFWISETGFAMFNDVASYDNISKEK